jgi:hypothetical protein
MGHCLSVCPFSCDHCIVYPTITASDYLIGILWPLYCLSNNYAFWLPLWNLVTIVLSIQQLWLLITSLESCDHCIVYPTITASDYLFGILWPLYCLSNNYGFRLPLWNLQTFLPSLFMNKRKNVKNMYRSHKLVFYFISLFSQKMSRLETVKAYFT